jgi:hypothetical protein
MPPNYVTTSKDLSLILRCNAPWMDSRDLRGLYV